MTGWITLIGWLPNAPLGEFRDLRVEFGGMESSTDEAVIKRRKQLKTHR